jgi:sugar O-acyltransferase (sialic acid O-acetyltransferase NeuD family)
MTDSPIRKYCIYGTGGFGREVLTILEDVFKGNGLSIVDNVCFMISDEFYDESLIMGVPVIKESDFIVDDYKVVIGIADPYVRKKIVDRLSVDTCYASIIHPRATISRWVEIGEGCVIGAGVILTCSISVGKHAHLNLSTTIGHDCEIGDFFTAAPSVSVSGNCRIGDYVYMGTKAATREKVSICSDVTIGMCSIVLKNIEKKGVYVGQPLRRLK